MATPTAIINTANLLAKSISRGKITQRAAMLTVPLDFSVGAVIAISIPTSSDAPNVSGIAGIQSIFIDNSSNSAALTLAIGGGPTLVTPAYSQATFPLFVGTGSVDLVATSGAGGKAALTLLNTREQAMVWAGAYPIAGSVNVTGSTVSTQAASGVYTDASGVIAVANVSQVLSAAGARLGFIIRNPATAASQNIAAPEPIYVNFGAAAAVNGATSWELLPGESLLSGDIGIVSSQAINAAAATVGHIIIAKTF